MWVTKSRNSVGYVRKRTARKKRSYQFIFSIFLLFVLALGVIAMLELSSSDMPHQNTARGPDAMGMSAKEYVFLPKLDPKRDMQLVKSQLSDLKMHNTMRFTRTSISSANIESTAALHVDTVADELDPLSNKITQWEQKFLSDMQPNHLSSKQH